MKSHVTVILARKPKRILPELRRVLQPHKKDDDSTNPFQKHYWDYWHFYPKKSAPMERKKISSGSSFEKEIGYSRAIVDGNWVFVSGTTGYDYNTMSISDDILLQTEQCLKNIEQALQQADSKMEDIVRVTYILPDASDFEKCWPILRKYFGEVRPAATMFSAGLADPRMKIEIQVTALKRSL